MVTAMTSTGHPRAEDYRYKRGAADIRCCHVGNPASPHDEWARREIVTPALRALHDEFGIVAEELAFGEVPEPRAGVLTYVLYGPTNPLAKTGAERRYLAALARTGARTNILSAYPL